MTQSKLDELRAQMEQIVKLNPAKAFDVYERQIAIFEDELREAAVRVKSEIAFSELDPQLATVCFNQEHAFMGADYRLCWEAVSDGGVWALFVLNQKSGGKRLLLDCPGPMKQLLASKLSLFANKIAAQFNQLS